MIDYDDQADDEAEQISETEGQKSLFGEVKNENVDKLQMTKQQESDLQ